MSNEVKAVCAPVNLRPFLRRSPRRDCRSLALHSSFGQQLTLVNEIRYTISPSSRNTITQGTIIHKKSLPTIVGQTAHDHPALCYELFVRITPKCLCLNTTLNTTFGVSCVHRENLNNLIVSFGPRDRSAVTRLRVHDLCHGRHGPALHHPYDHCYHARGSLKCDRRELLDSCGTKKSLTTPLSSP